MPRNSSGVYTLPPTNPVVPFTTIATSWANPTLSDIGNELTNSLDRSGRGGMLASFRLFDGTLSQPGLAWLNEPNMGIWRNGAGVMNFAVSGQNVMQMALGKVTTYGVLDIRNSAEFRLTGAKNWELDNPDGDFWLTPSATIDGSDWDIAKSFIFGADTGSLDMLGDLTTDGNLSCADIACADVVSTGAGTFTDDVTGAIAHFDRVQINPADGTVSIGGPYLAGFSYSVYGPTAVYKSIFMNTGTETALVMGVGSSGTTFIDTLPVTPLGVTKAVAGPQLVFRFVNPSGTFITGFNSTNQGVVTATGLVPKQYANPLVAGANSLDFGSVGQTFNVSISGNTTLDIVNVPPGAIVRVVVQGTANGTFALTINGAVPFWPNGTLPSLTAGPLKIALFNAHVYTAGGVVGSVVTY